MSHTVHAIIAVIESVLPEALPEVPPGGDGVSPIFSDPPASAPPELRAFASRVFGFMKAVGLMVGVVMAGYASIKIGLGKSQRHHMAAEGMQHWVYILLAVGGLFMAIPIIDFFATDR